MLQSLAVEIRCPEERRRAGAVDFPRLAWLPLLIIVWSVLAAGRLSAADSPAGALETDPQGAAFFESKVRPVLVRHCYACHSAQAGKSEGGLLLDTRAGLLKGGDRGPAIVPGDVAGSLLLAAVSHADPDLVMPPKGQPLSAAAIADLREWIRRGAPDPRGGEAVRPAGSIDLEAGRRFWSLQPVVDHPAPEVREPAWVRRPLDAFILAALEQREMAPSADCAPATFLRRLYFDLIGLPPTPEELSAFVTAVESVGFDAAAVEVVDRLLARPQYGERWGRHWLDVARFAESSGKEANISFPDAWRYRDYVIDCFNADVPYDRFLIEQIAGDLLPAADDAERARLLIATGFLAVGPKNLDEGNRLQFLADVIDEQIDAVSRAVLASSVACARCHDHKLDPYRMEDYYALAGIFASTKTCFGTIVSPANQVGGDPLPLPRLPDQFIFHASIPPQKVAELKAELAELRGENKPRNAAPEVKSTDDLSTIELDIREILRVFWRSGAIEGQLKKVDEQGRALPLAIGAVDAEWIVDVPLLERGELGRPGPTIPRGFPAVFDLPDAPPLPADQSGRLELARWLTRADHPLTARVFVNRVWRQVFGAGIVRTVDDFGQSGAAPTHPELLDHLARQFVAGGWSTKQLVRELVLSRTYRQASTYSPQSFETDPDNHLLWRMSKRRLDAEAIRDAMLAASGELDLARPPASLVGRVIGDRPIALIGLDKRLPPDLDGSVHRSVYLPVLRDRLPDVLSLFDFAEPSLVTGSRDTTNVPIQALYVMNSPFVAARATALARRLERETPDAEAFVERAFQRCFSRRPTPDEKQAALVYLATAGRSAGSDQPGEDVVRVSFCQALLATAEFRNTD